MNEISTVNKTGTTGVLHPIMRDATLKPHKTTPSVQSFSRIGTEPFNAVE
ncbi:MAG: hypothetical protein ACX93P_07790 [Roseovarius sp.]|nr:hypothetical protein [Roseovarius sp.]